MTTSNKVRDLLERAYIGEYGIRSSCKAEVISTSERDFDLDDSAPVHVIQFGEGQFSFHNPEPDEIAIASYERFVDQCVSPRSFLTGRKKCDYLLVREGENGLSLLLEISSALGDVASLTLPIRDKRGTTVRYPGGKFEKAVEQLSGSLNDLLAVAEIRNYLFSKPKRICVLSYRIFPHTDPDYLLRHPFEHYLIVESAETKENGAIIPCPEIEANGFEYRRICHPGALSA